VGKETSIPGYVNAINKELRIASTYLSDYPLNSVYFGGGTPSLLSVSHYQDLLEAINAYFSVSPQCEISMEANPGTISFEYLCHIKALGINRLSLGVQSTDAFDLTRLDRSHTIDDVLDGVLLARRAGFENINLDLIFNLPWQTLSSWEHSLSRALALKPEHFSLYSLIIEKGTPLYNWHQRGMVEFQNEDLEAEMYELAMIMLKDAGYVHYEISNWAIKNSKQDFRCIHNLQYWLNLPYLGIGAGAHGYVGNIRTENVHRIEAYISRVCNYDELFLRYPETPATWHTSEVDLPTQMKDFMWLGLRLVNEGVSVDRFFQTYGLPMFEVFRVEIMELINLGLVRWLDENNQRLKLTHRGVMLANQVFMRFV